MTKLTHFAINKDATPSDQDQLLLPNEGDEAMDLAMTLNSPYYNHFTLRINCIYTSA